jgi:hypothetical protein
MGHTEPQCLYKGALYLANVFDHLPVTSSDVETMNVSIQLFNTLILEIVCEMSTPYISTVPIKNWS